MKNTVYGYARISTRKQSIERQIRNIKGIYLDAVVLKEAYTGTTTDRPEWNKLYKKIKAGDTIVFDSVSRMSRNADEGIELYMDLFLSHLRSLQEPGQVSGCHQRNVPCVLQFQTQNHNRYLELPEEYKEVHEPD